jgi:hypothetical protein
MLLYHPALDPYHSAFRMIQLLTFSQSVLPIERDRVRILDFYLAIPSLISKIRVSPQFRRNRGLAAGAENKYRFSGIAGAVLYQMQSLQELALALLTTSGLIDRTLLETGVVVRTSTPLPIELANAIALKNAEESARLTFLTIDLATIPLLGKDGLKHRSTLLDHRYDQI